MLDAIRPTVEIRSCRINSPRAASRDPLIELNVAASLPNSSLLVTGNRPSYRCSAISIAARSSAPIGSTILRAKKKLNTKLSNIAAAHIQISLLAFND
jgi:hypothetical protein